MKIVKALWKDHISSDGMHERWIVEAKIGDLHSGNHILLPAIAIHSSSEASWEELSQENHK